MEENYTTERDTKYSIIKEYCQECFVANLFEERGDKMNQSCCRTCFRVNAILTLKQIPIDNLRNILTKYINMDKKMKVEDYNSDFDSDWDWYE